jgi:hypothetical protein
VARERLKRPWESAPLDFAAIKAALDAYAHCADRRDAKGQIALFTENTAFHVFMDIRNGGSLQRGQAITGGTLTTLFRCSFRMWPPLLWQFHCRHDPEKFKN